MLIKIYNYDNVGGKHWQGSVNCCENMVVNGVPTYLINGKGLFDG